MIIATTKVHQEKVYIPKEVRERFDIHNGDTLIWAVENGTLILRTQEKKKEKKDRFKVYKSQ